MASRSKSSPRYVVMQLGFNERGAEVWQIIDGRKIISTDFTATQYREAMRVFSKYMTDK